MESGVLAAMLAGAQGTDIGSAAEIARDGATGLGRQALAAE